MGASAVVSPAELRRDRLEEPSRPLERELLRLRPLPDESSLELDRLAREPDRDERERSDDRDEPEESPLESSELVRESASAVPRPVGSPPRARTRPDERFVDASSDEDERSALARSEDARSGDARSGDDEVDSSALARVR